MNASRVLALVMLATGALVVFCPLSQAQLLVPPGNIEEIAAVANDYRQRLSRTANNIAEIEAKIATTKSRLADVDSDYEQHRSRKPVRRRDSDSLRLGEFESESDFETRKNIAKRKELSDYNAALSAWESKGRTLQKSAATRGSQLRQQIGSLEQSLRREQKLLVAHAWATPDMPFLYRHVDYKVVELPHFNRERMRFGPFSLPIFPEGVDYIPKDSSDQFVRFAQTLQRINARADVFSSLQEAADFKEDFRSGKIHFFIAYAINLVDIESPIVVQEERREERESQVTAGNAARIVGALALGALGAAAGTPPEQIGDVLGNAMVNDENLRIRPEKRTVVVSPRIEKPGVRYHFRVSPYIVNLVHTTERELVPRQLVAVDPGVKISKIRSDPDNVFHGVDVGDTILSVGGAPIYDVTVFNYWARKVKLGETATIRIRKAATGQEIDCIYNGGSVLNIAVE